MTNVHTDLAS